MTKQRVFKPYFPTQHERYLVFSSEHFRETACAISWDHAPEVPALLTTNFYLERFAKGEPLSRGIIRKEGVGFAIAAGSIRFYFIYSEKFANVVILAIARFKNYKKLRLSDQEEMKEARKAFDGLDRLPE